MKLLGIGKNADVVKWLHQNVDAWKNVVDDNGNNVLMVCCMIGRVHLVEKILEMKLFGLTTRNNDLQTPLDLAVMYGYWKTYDVLRKYGFVTLGEDCNCLFRTCISKNYYQTATRLLNDGYVAIDDDMINNAPTNYATTWLSQRSNKDIDVTKAIEKGMSDIVEKKLDQIPQPFSWKPYLHLFTKPSADHLKTVEILLKSGKTKPDEIMDIQVENNDKEMEDEVTWPLFAVCEKGYLEMFHLLLNYVDVEMAIGRQNCKGTTPLWIAVCNKHIDLVAELIALGADVNKCNFKGDSPLIPAIQKGSETLVEMLLDAGAQLGCFNKNRDGPVLICCRNGHMRILETLFKHCTDEERKEYQLMSADIDGLNPILASTELDKAECIKVCHKYGADLECRTAIDNVIIQGATPLHLACFYNRVNSIRVLCDLGADLKSQTTVGGYTPLHIAIKQGHVNAVRFLLTKEAARECLQIQDSEGRLPSYYAQQAGNEELLDEFFTNKLAVCLGTVFDQDQETINRCTQTLMKYGQSLGVYDYNEITNMDMGQGQTPLTMALFNGDQNLIKGLRLMGADFNKRDDYGLSPAFWESYLGYDLGIKPSSETLEQLDRVKNLCIGNVQNKMLLNVKPGKPETLESLAKDFNVMIKMNDGFDYNVDKGVLTNLKSSGIVSLLGFMENLKRSGKEFSSGKKEIEWMIWDSKVHLVKMAASGQTKLQPIHQLALYMYTGNMTIFKRVNKALTEWNKNSTYQPFINCLYQAVSLLPDYAGEVYRAVDFPFDPEIYKVGNTLTWSTFGLACSDWRCCTELMNLKRGMIFIIKSKCGKKIHKFSKTPQDQEVLFLPFTTFKITAYYRSEITCLGQANIRNSTYKIRDVDIANAEKNKSSIILELEEIGVTPPASPSKASKLIT